MTRVGGSPSSVLAILALIAVSAPNAGCAIAGPEGAHRSDCENRGYTRGTAAYDRCLRDTGGRAFLEDVNRRRPFGR